MQWSNRALILFHRKGSTGLKDFPKIRPFGLSGKSPPLCCLLRVVLSAKTLCKSRRATLFLPEKRNQHTPIFERIKKRSLMNKQKVNMTSSMNEKGYSSSSHYRISSEFEQNEQSLGTNFVHWDVPPLESLCSSKVLLRMKLNRGEMMSREEKNWLCEAVNSNTYFRTAVPLQGYRFDFFDVLKKYLVNQYGQWTEYYAPDRKNKPKSLPVWTNQSNSRIENQRTK